jgi:predicted dehydrogenase
VADQLKAILVGCGGISGTWVNAAKEIEDFKLIGFVDLNEAAAQGRADQYGNTEAVISSDLEATLAQLKPDIVFDCTVPEAHVAVTQMALWHGAHVLVEKPLADSMDHARQMLSAANESGKTLAVMQNRRFDPNIRRLRALLDSGQIGPLTALNSDFYIGAHFDGFRTQMSHVLLLDMAIHTFDAARFISGADPVAVYCKEWNPAGSWFSHGASALAIFEMSNNLVYSYRGSWTSEGLRSTWESEWRVNGVSGSARWYGDTRLEAQVVSGSEGLIHAASDVPVPDEIPAAKTGGHLGCIREFVDCVRSGQTPETVASDNIKSLAMVFAAIESAESGKSVQIFV